MDQDERIRNNVQDEIAWDPRVKSTEIGVTVKNGAVCLTGTVGSYAERLAAEEAAKRVSGVHAIAEDITITLPEELEETDEGVAERISNILEWNMIAPDADVQAEVRNGFVTLTGDVEWNFERETIKNQIAHLKGVRGIDNRIKLQSRVSERDVARNIARALHRNADLEKSKIDISVEGGKVVLNGNVKAFYEKELIEKAAWGAPGVTEVIDNLSVDVKL